MKITEDYVSFETAKLLKEKGFNEYCYTCYIDEEIAHYDYHSTNFELIDGVISAPTLQMTMKWLLKKYNIFICPLFLEESNGFGYTIENIIKKKYIATSKNSSYKNPEKACKAAILYCLKNLI